MNFANSSSKPQSSYHRGSSYYHGHHNKYSRHQHGHHSNHRGARSSSQHQGYGAYHPRIINTTASSSNNPSNSNSLSPIKLKPATAPQQNQQLQAKAAHANNNNINTNTHKPTTYHFSAKSSEMFMKKKIMTNSNANITPQSNQQSLTSNNTQKPSRFDSKPAFSPNGAGATALAQVQLLNNTYSTLTPISRTAKVAVTSPPTISFSSQHTPQSFIASNTNPTATHTTNTLNINGSANNSPGHTLSTVSTATSTTNLILPYPAIVTTNDVNGSILSTAAISTKTKPRKSRWNAKPDHLINTNSNITGNVTSTKLNTISALLKSQLLEKTISGPSNLKRSTSSTSTKSNNDDRHRRHRHHSSSRSHSRRHSHSRRSSHSSHSRSRSRSRHKPSRKGRKIDDDESDSEDDMSMSDTSESFSTTPQSSNISSSNTPRATQPQSLVIKDENKDNFNNLAKKLSLKLEMDKKKYILSEDVILLGYQYKNNIKRNYAKEELLKKHKCTQELQTYIKRSKRKRSRKSKIITDAMNKKFKAGNNYISDNELADNEEENDDEIMTKNKNKNGDDKGQKVKGKNKGRKRKQSQEEIYNRDYGNSDFAIYEPPFKKPKYMKKMKDFAESKQVPKHVIKRADGLNKTIQNQRHKKAKLREAYINERKMSQYWNQPLPKSWFFRCVYMLEGHVLTMCSSPDMAAGVSYPRRPLDEIENQLNRIHPLPLLLYKRLFKTLGNLANLIRTYPDAVVWNKAKLKSVFQKAIRKQQQMKSIYNFKTAAIEEYDFTPYQLPEYETHRVSFYIHQQEDDADDEAEKDDKHKKQSKMKTKTKGKEEADNDNGNENENQNENDTKMEDLDGKDDRQDSIEALLKEQFAALNPLNRQMSATVDGPIEDEDEEDEDNDDEMEEGSGPKSRSLTPFEKEQTPALSLTSNPSEKDMDIDKDNQFDNINRLPTKLKKSDFANKFNNIKFDKQKKDEPEPDLPMPMSQQSQSQTQSQPSSQQSSVQPMSQSITPCFPMPTTMTPCSSPIKPPILLASTLSTPSRKKRHRPSDGLLMETHLNLELVRKTVPINFEKELNRTDDHGKFVISPKIQKLVTDNFKRIQERNSNAKKKKLNINTKSSSNNSNKNSNGQNHSSSSRRDRHSTRNRRRSDYTGTWRIETIDSEDENVPIHDRNQKKALKAVMDNNYVHGPMPAKGLEPTQQQIPTLYQFPSKWRNVDDIKAPSLSYLIANYIDTKDPHYIKMLTKFFTVQLTDCIVDGDENEQKEDNNNNSNKNNKPKFNDAMTSKMVRKHLRKHPKSLKHCWIGTAVYDGNNSKDTVNNFYCQQSTLVMEVWLDMDNNNNNGKTDKIQCVRLQLNEGKRHKLLCKMLRVKNKHKKEIKQRKHSAINLSLIPQPPPPPKSDIKKSKKPKSSQRMDQLKKMGSICVNYNWNGNCEVKYCGKKHICVACFEKHPARICKKICFSFNWSKCHKYCPDGKTHVCAQCGDNKHPAWKCQYLHSSIVQKFYFIYKSKKIRNGYFKTLENKEIKKDCDWIHKKRIKFQYFDTHQQNSLLHQQRHQQQQQQQHMLQHHIHNFNNNLNNLQNQQMNNNNNNNINNMNNHRRIRHHHNSNHNNNHHHNNRNNHYGNQNNPYSHYQHNNNNNHYQKHHHHNKLKRRSSHSRK